MHHLRPADDRSRSGPPGSGRTRVVLANHHAGLCRSLRWLLEREDDLEVIGEAGDLETALHEVALDRPDVLVLDLRMPDGFSAERMKRLRTVSPSTEIVVTTMHANEMFVTEAIKAGAIGFVLADSADRELVDAVRAAARHLVYTSPRISGARAGSGDPGAAEKHGSRLWKGPDVGGLLSRLDWLKDLKEPGMTIRPKNQKDLLLAPVAVEIDRNLQRLRVDSPYDVLAELELELDRPAKCAEPGERAELVLRQALRDVDLHGWTATVSDDGSRVHLEGGSVSLDLGLSPAITSYIAKGVGVVPV